MTVGQMDKFGGGHPKQKSKVQKKEVFQKKGTFSLLVWEQGKYR